MSPHPCPRCGHRMAHLTLSGLDQRLVEVDHCGACRLVWFDALESVQLAPLGWVQLLRRLEEGGGLGLAPPLPRLPACPLCTQPLKAVQNRSRFGTFAMLECPQRHGHLHTHAGLLAERGLVRALLPLERTRLRSGALRLDCLNCGAPLSGDADHCRYCDSAVVVIDLPRLLHALTRPRHANDASPPPQGEPLAWPCLACGHPLDPQRDAQCPACGDPASAPGLHALAPLLDRAEVLLKDAASERLLKAASQRRVDYERPKRERDWRDTQFARLARFFRKD
ncbi:zf-TFIIB domain-containing protein [Inhella sp.]|uniref:TFIIB-type zinc ribbon-containing protein n=1 Tax=Inhella sp. TaxID=1921806 RepID=UPI0035AF8D2D